MLYIIKLHTMLYVSYLSIKLGVGGKTFSIKTRRQIPCNCLLELGNVALGGGSGIPKVCWEKAPLPCPQGSRYLGVNICHQVHYLPITHAFINTLSLFLNVNILIQLSRYLLKRCSAFGFQESGHCRQKGTRGVPVIYHVCDP